MPDNLFSDLQDEINNQQGEEWRKEWKGMPEFVQNDLMPEHQLIINFESIDNLVAFSKLVNQKITAQTKSIWYPEVKAEVFENKRYSDEP